MSKRRRRRRLHLPGTGTPGGTYLATTFEAEFFALLEARDKARETLGRLKKEGTEPQATALVRALALEAARGTTPDRFVQAKQQLETLEHQHKERIKALTEFVRRFDELVKSTRTLQRAQVEAALKGRIAQLEERKKLAGAPVEEIEAEIARWKKELEDLNSPPKVRAKPGPLRTYKT